jgi:hypothetical protein
MIEKYRNIMVSRKGDVDDSHMETISIIGIVSPNKCYKIDNDNLIETDTIISHETISDIEPIHFKIYNISHKWQDKEKIINNSNILGDNGILKLDMNRIDIPIAETTMNNLSFYSTILLKIGDFVQFDIENEMPITIMNIGKNYVKHYLLNQDKGCGSYLEYHNTPHFHMPLNKNSDGHVILGRIINDICYLSAFNIPYNYAIYIKPNVIHCDAYLTGDYLVVYNKTDHYSTVLLKNNGCIVDVNIK